ncbi:MAG: glycosyltransferase [Acidimicrobiales bacterium]
MLVAEVEVSRPLPAMAAVRPGGPPYERALVLVRLHHQPVGLVHLALDRAELAPGALAAAVWEAAAGAIASHLDQDGSRAPDRLEAGGLPVTGAPACRARRSTFLSDPPSLTVVIPTRDRPASLARCLDSVLACTYPASRFEVVVVDNVPTTDETRLRVEGYRPTGRVRYAREDRPGSASARNRGLELVETDLVAFTDDDAIVDTDWLVALAQGFEAADDVSAVTGLLLPREMETPAQVWFEQYGGFSRGFARQVYDLEHRPAGSPLYPYSAGVFGTGNNMAFRQAALAAIGGFDPALGNGTPALGGVDSEVLLRTILSGRRIVYEPTALAFHVHRADYAGLRRQVYSYGVGLSAYLLKTLMANPGLLGDFCRKVPSGLRFALSPRSPKNANKRGDYPPQLTWVELAGMLYGPLAYARSRRRFGPHPVPPDHRAEDRFLAASGP